MKYVPYSGVTFIGWDETPQPYCTIVRLNFIPLLNSIRSSFVETGTGEKAVGGASAERESVAPGCARVHELHQELTGPHRNAP